MSAHMPNSGSTQKDAAAWELIVASIILLLMILTRMALSKGKLASNKLVGFFMKEDEYGHLILYFVLFALVFSSALSFFIN